MIILISRSIAAIPFLSSLMGERVRFVHLGATNADVVAGWGVKRSGRRARRKAKRSELPALYLEDGFLRSFAPGRRFPPLSVAVDDSGIYYDATHPSRLEKLLNSGTDLLDGIAHDAARARCMILENGLSKYNHAPAITPSLLRPDDRGRVLVVDQTFGDLSISRGGARAESFIEMLEAARAENPGATIYVKTHPEVSSGRKGGHFGSLQADERTIVIRDAVNPLSLIAQMDRVYVVTSTMGFEALLAGKPVTCFGLPWYAGWGATDDRLPCPRRQARRSVEELFAAAYVHYPRYLDPVTRQRGTIFDCLDWLVRQRATEERLHGADGKGRMICVGFRRWKQANLAPLLALNPGRAIFVKDAGAARALHPQEGDHLVWWGSEAPPGVAELAAESGAGTMRMEDGFIRSVGLGSDLIAPLSLVLDKRGIYFDPRQPSELEMILADGNFSEEELAQAREVRRLIVERGLTKYNLEPRSPANWPSGGRPVILVPGQVEDDASIRFGCSDIRTNAGLLRAAREAAPEAFIVYKPHPDVMSGNRKGKLDLDQARQWADHIESGLSVISCIEACDEVHTMTSLTGFDALLRGKRVLTYGEPFYAGWGLTTDRSRGGAALGRRKRRLTLDELVAGTLLRYPLYWDPILKGYTRCEAVLNRITEQRDALEQAGKLDKLRLGFVRRQWRKARILAKAWLARQ
jgi:capsular polysaccharide export protein